MYLYDDLHFVTMGADNRMLETMAEGSYGSGFIGCEDRKDNREGAWDNERYFISIYRYISIIDIQYFSLSHAPSLLSLLSSSPPNPDP